MTKVASMKQGIIMKLDWSNSVRGGICLDISEFAANFFLKKHANLSLKGLCNMYQ